MTTHDLGHDLGHGVSPGTTAGEPVSNQDDDALGALFDSSPARPVHTSATAEIGFLAGLVALAAAPFSLMTGVCVGLSMLALLSSVVGLARSSRPLVAGSLLASIGLVLSLAAFAVVGVRYVGIDTAIGDRMLPTLADWLRSLNDLLPRT
ncbi:MAG: hypothetical protein JWQ93_919 [Marmoricola sp.]|jgi:hypothetical protein|nr:hypothetical protein [Marmoricola sp.]